MVDVAYDTSGHNLIEIGVGKLAVAKLPHVLMTPALGSCVGVTLYDKARKQGGMAHVMLPDTADTSMHGDRTRFASVAVPELVERLDKLGSKPRKLVAKIAGGAAMFKGQGHLATVGERNLREVKRQLAGFGIKIVAEDTGGSHARTIELYLDTGILVVRSYLYGIREL